MRTNLEDFMGTTKARKPRLITLGVVDGSARQELNDAGYDVEDFGPDPAFGIVLGEGWREELSGMAPMIVDIWGELPYGFADAWVYGDPKDGTPLGAHVVSE